MRRGGIILCGGRSSRMGVDKALLPFGQTTMLGRIVATVGSVASPDNTVIVAAAEQEIAPWAGIVVRDLAEYQGPLAAIVRGLEVLVSQVDAVFVTGCDTPLVSTSIISFLFQRLADFDCVVPRDEERIYPLCAVYRSSVLSQLRASNHRSLHAFISTLNARILPCNELLVLDPGLNSLLNINTQDDYVAALAAAGLSTP